MSSQSIRLVFAVILGVVGSFLVLGGIWLVVLGGSSFYVLQGLAFIAVAALIRARNPLALWVYAALVLLTMAWALLEVGLDWWQLAPRGDVTVALGIILVIPWVARSVRSQRRDLVFRSGWTALAGSMVVSLSIALIAVFTPSHDLAGNLPQRSGSDSEKPSSGAGKEWTAYGGTQAGRRYSTLDQITPQNVGKLKVAWTFHTGDVRSKEDPVETTYEVTPLKIGSSVYLCTPHDIVFALDAETGQKKWQYDPKVGEPPYQSTQRNGSQLVATERHGFRRLRQTLVSADGRWPLDRVERRNRQSLFRLRRSGRHRKSVAKYAQCEDWVLLLHVAADHS
jgi:quinoprotein glucose dehydrogenase